MKNRCAPRLLVLCTFVSLLSGCLWNSVSLLPSGGRPSSSSSVVVYGVHVEKAWGAQKFQVALNAYNRKESAVDGNCWHFNRAIATVSGTPGAMQYFAFEVPAGYYEYGGGEYFAPKGKTVFIGEIVYTGDKSAKLVRDLASSRPRILVALPDTDKDISLAESKPLTEPVQLFLCMP